MKIYYLCNFFKYKKNNVTTFLNYRSEDLEKLKGSQKVLCFIPVF